MKIILIVVFTLFSTMTVYSRESKVFYKKKSEMTPKELAEARIELERRTGGKILINQSGVVTLINYQSTITSEVLSPLVDGLGKALRINMTLVERKGGFQLVETSSEMAKVKANAYLFIVNDKTLPMTLLAPESKWALVNVAPMITDKPLPEKLNKRVQKMVMRTIALLLGAANSNYRGSVLDGVFSIKEVDALKGGVLMPDSLMAISNYLPQLGINQGKVISYRRACMDGIAPSPSNDLQRAVWDEVHKLPATAIKIKPETKKVKD